MNDIDKLREKLADNCNPEQVFKDGEEKIKNFIEMTKSGKVIEIKNE